MNLEVARIGRAHGLKGEVSLELRTDEPEVRFALGAAIATDPPSAGPLTVAASRTQGGRWYVRFEEVADREGAEALRGVLLVVEAGASDEEGAWYLHELVGMRVERLTGAEVGVVAGIEYPPAQDLLVIRETSGAISRIPFVAALVPVVDVPGGRIVVDPPFGLLAGEDVPDAD